MMRPTKKDKHENIRPKNPVHKPGELGRSVEDLMKRQRTSSDLIAELRHRRQAAQAEFDEELRQLDTKFLTMNEDLLREAEDLRSRLAEETHRNTILKRGDADGSKEFELPGLIQEATAEAELADKALADSLIEKETLEAKLEETRETKASAGERVHALQELLSELRADRRTLEADQERQRFYLETQADQYGQVERRLYDLDTELGQRNNENSAKYRQVAEDLERRYGPDRVRAELAAKENLLRGRLDNIARKTKLLHAEQLAEYAEKTRQIAQSVQTLVGRQTEHGEVREALEAERARAEAEQAELDRGIAECEAKLKDAAYIFRESNEASVGVLDQVRDNVHEYLDITNAFQKTTADKIEVLLSLEEAKQTLAQDEENITPTGNDSLFESEAESGNSDFEDDLLSRALFPGMSGDLEGRDLKLEAWVFGQRITITNTGVRLIQVKDSKMALVLKKSKKELVFDRDFELGPGEYVLVVRRGHANTQGAKEVVRWDENFDGFVHDEALLYWEGTPISKSLVFSDDVYEKVNSPARHEVKERTLQGNGDSSFVGYFASKIKKLW